METAASEKRRNLVVLVDYENLQEEVKELGLTVNLKLLMRRCRTFGNVVLAFLFVPNYTAGDTFWDQGVEYGYYIIPTSVWKKERGGHKAYEKADSMMTEIGSRLVALAGIDEIIIVSNDGDFVPLANRALDLGKKVMLLGGRKVSGALIQSLDYQTNWRVPMTKLSEDGVVVQKVGDISIGTLTRPRRGPQSPVQPPPRPDSDPTNEGA